MMIITELWVGSESLSLCAAPNVQVRGRLRDA